MYNICVSFLITSKELKLLTSALVPMISTFLFGSIKEAERRLNGTSNKTKAEPVRQRLESGHTANNSVLWQLFSHGWSPRHFWPICQCTTKHWRQYLGYLNHNGHVHTVHHSANLTWKTSSSRILVPNTVMPSVLMEAWSLLRRGLVIFFLQSTMMVTVFFSTLMATRCHLIKDTTRRNERSQSVQMSLIVLKAVWKTVADI